MTRRMCLREACQPTLCQNGTADTTLFFADPLGSNTGVCDGVFTPESWYWKWDNSRLQIHSPSLKRQPGRAGTRRSVAAQSCPSPSQRPCSHLGRHIHAKNKVASGIMTRFLGKNTMAYTGIVSFHREFRRLSGSGLPSQVSCQL